MTNPWTPEIELSSQEASKLIGTQFPQLNPIQISFLGLGFDNTVFKVNNQYIFRFPRRTIAVDLLKTENQLLPHLAKNLNLPIPTPIFFGSPSSTYPWPFTGYQAVNGETPRQLTEEIRLLSVESIAEFLRTLHQFPIDMAKNLHVPNDQLNRLSIPIRRKKLEENVNIAVADGLIKNPEVIGNYLKRLKSVEVNQELALVHGDLHFKNLLVDNKGLITGVIDWGDVHIGHRAVDLSIVYSFFPPAGRKRFFEIYGNVDEITRYLARFKAIFTSIMLVRFAHEHNDQEAFDAAGQALNMALAD
ncbi:phosphotransferase [Neobacillus bataviensis]|uniref:phosphotransferase n=1 Tax=Neobacillus bataviensis TaxID=220685 RepID=UPI001CBA7F5D|nr:phosphotransferase [Neobacillus bataviensis]